MTIEFTRKAKERSSFTITVVYKEVSEDGEIDNFITPNEGLSWTLKDEDGVVVNSRLNVPLTPSVTSTITLKGDDLALSADYPEKRYVIIEGTYDGVGGVNLPIRDGVVFQIENLK